MSLSTRSIATICVTVVLGLETFAISATAASPNFQQQPSTSNSASTLLPNQEAPILLAQNTKRKVKKSRTKKSKPRQPRPKKSSALIREYENIYYRGRQAAYECIVGKEGNSATKECRELVAIKSSLTNLCY